MHVVHAEEPRPFGSQYLAMDRNVGGKDGDAGGKRLDHREVEPLSEARGYQSGGTAEER